MSINTNVNVRSTNYLYSAGRVLDEVRKATTVNTNQLLLGLLLIFSQSIGICQIVTHGTAIFGIRSPKEIILGSDSKAVSVTLDGGGTVNGTRRKISYFNGRFVAIAGTYNIVTLGDRGDTVASADVFPYAEKACRTNHPISMLPKIMDGIAYKKMLWIHQQYLANKGDKPQRTSFIFFGWEGESPTFSVLDYSTIVGRDDTLARSFGVSYMSTDSTRSEYIYGGTGQPIMVNFLQYNRNELIPLTGIKRIERVIQAAIDSLSEDIGPPIDVVRITKNAVEWNSDNCEGAKQYKEEMRRDKKRKKG